MNDSKTTSGAHVCALSVSASLVVPDWFLSLRTFSANGKQSSFGLKRTVLTHNDSIHHPFYASSKSSRSYQFQYFNIFFLFRFPLQKETVQEFSEEGLELVIRKLAVSFFLLNFLQEPFNQNKMFQILHGNCFLGRSFKKKLFHCNILVGEGFLQGSCEILSRSSKVKHFS